MSWISAAISIGGGLLGRRGAKDDRAAQMAQLELQRKGFDRDDPYIRRFYESGEAAKDAAKSKGYYSGETLAGMNPYTSNALNRMGAASGANMGIGQDLINQGRGFGANYGDIYADASKTGGTLGAAQDYAMKYGQPLIDAALRDSQRNLQENTLTGIDRGASSSGNMNSSRAGVTEAIARRDYADRAADVGSDIRQDLAEQYTDSYNQDMANRMAATRGLQDTFDSGMDSTGTFADWGTKAGAAFTADEQRRLDDARMRFEGERDFDLDLENKYGSGILNRANYNSPQNPRGVTASPNAGMLSGFATGYGAAPKITDWWNSMQRGRAGNAAIRRAGTGVPPILRGGVS